MTTEDITSLFKTSDRLVSEVSLSHHRYLAGEIDWRNRLVCIKGARGTGKGFSQIAGIPDSYVVNDDTTIGVGKKIPLWLFGFLY